MQQGITHLLDYNRQQSERFRSSDAVLARKLYKAQHPTAIAALKCMDGRLNLPVIAQIVPGIIQPWRNLGGRFDLGWPYFNRLMLDWVYDSLDQGRDCLVLVSYHFSKGDTHRGCKGFGYDTEAAKNHTQGLVKQLETVFGHSHAAVYPVQVGIETDEDSFVIHGANGEVLDLAQWQSNNPIMLEAELRRLFPDMKDQVIADFMPLLTGNLAHIAEIRAKKRPIDDAEHKEWILALGRGFDWLHLLNAALIIGPYSPDLATPIRIGASLLLDNIKSGRVDPKKGIVLMASSPTFAEDGPEWEAAKTKSEFLANLAMEEIDRDVPELKPYLKCVIGVINMNTYEFIETGKSVEKK